MSFLVKLWARIFVLRAVITRLRSESDTAPSTFPSRTSTHATRAEETASGGIPTQTGEGASPDSPLDLEKSDWKATVKRTLKEIKTDRVTLVAAGMAYYFFLAIFPAFIALVGLMDLFNIDPSGLVETVRSTLPKGAGDVLADPLQRANESPQGSSVTAAITGIGLALWSASSGMIALQGGLNIAYDIKEDRKFLGKRGIGILLLLATAMFGGVPSPLFTFGDALIFTILGWVLTIVAVTVLFSLYYYLGPKRESPKWTWVSAGGVLGTLIWIAASVAFGVYVAEFGQYGKTYGPAAGVIVLILWLYLTSLSVLIGGELNAELERQAERRKEIRQS
jgi:membrane protein